MSPDGGGEPDGELGFGDRRRLRLLRLVQGRVQEAGITRFGSGWAWLVHDGIGPRRGLNRQPGLARLDGQTPLLGSTSGSTPTT